MVNSLVPNGAAELSAAQLSTGDKLLAIDGVDVINMNARKFSTRLQILGFEFLRMIATGKISQLVLGPEDSVVNLRFESSTDPRTVFEVAITRRRPRPCWQPSVHHRE